MIEKSELSEALREYYMPYAMKVITDRALPDVRDGLKPIARKILWTLWNNGVKNNVARDKSGKIVGDILKIHNHGDSSVYGAMALLTEQNESLLHPFIDGEGAFGKIYSNDSPSAMRYTSARLNKFAEEMFVDINKNAVKFIGEDKSHLQPLILTNSFPNVLTKPNSGVAVGEACNWASFNLKEVCSLTQSYIKNKSIDIWDYLQAPDFSTGGYIIISKNEMNKIFETGRGSFKLRAKYRYNKENNTIEIYEIPYNTTVDDIIKDINNLINKGLVKDILDVKDETGFDKKLKKEVMGIGIELKKNSNVDILMKILFKKTRLETSFSCNFNCLVNYKPKTLGIKSILDEWINFRIECIKNAMIYDINEKEKLLHYLKGLEKVLLDIDKAINIIRHSENDEMILSNLITTFKIDDSQAIEISNMKLKNINEKYILNKIKSINDIDNEINTLKINLTSKSFIENTIIFQLEQVKNKYGNERKTEIIYENQIEKLKKEDMIESYNCTILVTKENYIKKLLKNNEKQNLKEGDCIVDTIQTSNNTELTLISNKNNLYRIKTHELDERKPSQLGTYLKTIIDLEDDEYILKIIPISKEIKNNEYILYCFENGKIAKVDLKSFKMGVNKINNKAYNIDSKLINIIQIDKDIDILMKSSINKVLITNTKYINSKASKNTSGTQVQKQKNDSITELCVPIAQITGIENLDYYKTESGKGIGNYILKTDTIDII